MQMGQLVWVSPFKEAAVMAFRIDKWKGHGLIDTWILLWQAMLICHLTDVLNRPMYLSIRFLQLCNIWRSFVESHILPFGSYTDMVASWCMTNSLPLGLFWSLVGVLTDLHTFFFFFKPAILWQWQHYRYRLKVHKLPPTEMGVSCKQCGWVE